MAERRNEISGGQFHGPVVQAGSVDQVVIQVAQEHSEPTHAVLTRWNDRPPLTPALKDLLEAQQKATESLPYKLLGVKKPETLHDVYVKQSVRFQPPERSLDSVKGQGESKTASDASESPLTIPEAINRARHLVITGEPGAGKSTLGYMYVQQIANFWLSADGSHPPVTDPVLPLRIPARALAAESSWSELLAAGAQDVLKRLLTERPRAELFARRALGARWLIFIDGLDEITQVETRRQVIASIAHQIHRSADHRIVITTRPLPSRELEPLERAGVVTYGLQPFGPPELGEFAKAWFRAQDPITMEERAAEFLRQVYDGRLRELVANPLLATIAAIANTINPERSLPNNRAGLYDRFMTYLLGDKASGRNTIVELRRTLRDQPKRLSLAEWISEHLPEVIERLADLRLKTERPLIDAASEWIGANQPVLSEFPDEWEEDLRTLLFGTGLFVHTEAGPQFLHHSFAEFLAARWRAQEIAPHFPDLDVWIERGLQPATESFALFTFVLWAAAGHDIGLVLRRLLDSGRDQVLLAGRLVAEDVAVTCELAAAVLDRIVEVILSNGTDSDPWIESEEIGQVLALLGTRTGGPFAERLYQLRDTPELAAVTRIECAIALGNLANPTEAVDWLERFADEVDPDAVERIVTAVAKLVPDGAHRAERLLVRLGSNAGHDYVITMAVIVMLLDLGRTGQAATLVRDLVRRLRSDPGVASGGGALPARSTTARVPLRIADSWEANASSWGDLADLAHRSGCPDEARWAARMAFQNTTVREELDVAVAAMLSVSGADAVPEIMAVARSRPTDQLLDIAQSCGDAGFLDVAIELVQRRVLSQPTANESHLTRAAEILLSCRSDLVANLQSYIEQRPYLTSARRTGLARAMAEANQPADANRLANQDLADPTITPEDFWAAAEIVLTTGGDDAAETVFQAATKRPPAFWAQAAPVLSEAGHSELAADLVTRLLDTEPEVDVLIEAAIDFHRLETRELADGLLTAALARLDECEPNELRRLAKALTEAGRTDDATTVARLAFRSAIANDVYYGNYGTTWLKAGGSRCVDDIVAELLATDIDADSRMNLASEFADAGLLAPAVAVWLDVVRHHGNAVEHGVQAADRLVRCGHRTETIDALRDALADDRLTALSRTRLHALLAWVIFLDPAATRDQALELLG